jgi:hypothetical protein
MGGKMVKKIISFIFLIFLLFNSNSLFAQGTLLIIPEVKIASSPNPVGSGARAAGMGNAFIGVADDATAASWNPGGLMQLETPEFSVVYDYNYQDYHDEGTNSYDKINYFSAALPFSLFNKKMIISLNYQRLYDFYMPSLDFSQKFFFQYPDGKSLDLTQNIKYNQSGNLKAFAPAYAVQITPRLSVGATFNMNFGFLWDITNIITIGGVFKTPYKADFKHTYETSSSQIFPTAIGSSSYSTLKYKEDFELEFPMSWGLGMALRFSDRLTVGLDCYWTKWDQFLARSKNRVLLDQFPRSWPPGQIDQPPSTKVSPIDGFAKNVDLTTQVHLGMESLFILKKTIIPLRLGVFYDPEPSHDNPEDFWGASIGSGIMLYDRIIIDVAYIFRTGNNVKKDVAGYEMDIDQNKMLLSMIYHF